MFTFEFSKQIVRHFAQNIDQHIQATTVRHANHNLLDTITAGALNGFVQRGNETLATLERKTLLANIFGV